MTEKSIPNAHPNKSDTNCFQLYGCWTPSVLALQGQTINQHDTLSCKHKSGNLASVKFAMTQHLPTHPRLCGKH